MRTYFYLFLCFVLFFILFNPAHLATLPLNMEMKISNFIYQANEALTGDNIIWPYSWRYSLYSSHYSILYMLSHYGVLVGQNVKWNDPLGVPHKVQVAQTQQHIFADIGKVMVPDQKAFKLIFRKPYPTKIINGQDLTNPIYRECPVDPNLPADAVFYTKQLIWPDYNGGLELERWVYGFANDENFIFQEFVLTNISDTTRDGVYLAISAQTNAGTKNANDVWGNYYGTTFWKYVNGNLGADSLRMWYSWDADSRIDPYDDKGNPNPEYGNFEEPQYMGMLVVHADRSATDEKDDPHQPIKAGWGDENVIRGLNKASHEELYALLSESWESSTDYAVLVDSLGEENENGKYRILKTDFNEYTEDPGRESDKIAMLSFGPYTLKPGEDVRVVVAFVGGVIPLRLAIDAGKAYDNGNPSRLEGTIAPLPYDVYDLKGQCIARQGFLLTTIQKDAILAISKDILFRNAARAFRLWKNGNVKKGKGSFNIPLAPAAPSVNHSSDNDNIHLTWHPVEDAVAYRVYRLYERNVPSVAPTDTFSVLLAEVGPSITEYRDWDVIRGNDYFYYITAVNQFHLESSPWLNITSDAPCGCGVLYAFRGPDADWIHNVVVVPNPYHVSAAEKYASRQLRFLNLPAYCNIHIYTVLGDHIQTIHHNSSHGDEVWENQETFTGNEIVSGIYIYVVEELDGPDGKPTGRKAIGKFVVIK